MKSLHIKTFLYLTNTKEKMKKILQETLKQIKPKNSKIKQAEEFIKTLNTAIKRKKIEAKAMAGGSYAKNTWLKGEHDIDIFVKFKPKYANKDLSKILSGILRKHKPEKIHGSRDYYWVRNKYQYEIIPVLDIKKPNQAQNVTDFSPWHVKWVNKEGKKLKDDIRLAKKFCKAQECYGAESYIHGFSGHVVDILTIYYKGFIPLLKASQKWKPKVIIDYYNKTGKKAVFMLNKSKIQGPMIIIDPVQPERNAAAALNKKNFDKFVEAAKKFLKKPGRKFFKKQEINYTKLQKKGKLVRIKITAPKGKEDPTGAKLLKAFEFIRKKLDKFEIKNKGWEWDKKKNAEFWYVLGKEKLPETYEIQGPPKEMKEHAKKFRKKHKKTLVKKGRLYAKIKYKQRDVKNYLKKEVLNSDYLKDKVKKCILA